MKFQYKLLDFHHILRNMEEKIESRRSGYLEYFGCFCTLKVMCF